MSTYIQKFEPVLRQNIIDLAGAYTKATELELKTVSRRVYGDAVFLDRVVARTGDFSVRIYDDVVSAFFRLWPEGVAWPVLKDPYHFPNEEPITNGQGPKKVGKKVSRTKGGKGRKAKARAGGKGRKKARRHKSKRISVG